jgi:hypothetical protein
MQHFKLEETFPFLLNVAEFWKRYEVQLNQSMNFIREYELESGQGKNEHRFSHNRLASSMPLLTSINLPITFWLSFRLHVLLSSHSVCLYVDDEAVCNEGKAEEQVADFSPYPVIIPRWL